MAGGMERGGEEAFREDQERRHLHPSTGRGAHSAQKRRAQVKPDESHAAERALAGGHCV